MTKIKKEYLAIFKHKGSYLQRFAQFYTSETENIVRQCYEELSLNETTLVRYYVNGINFEIEVLIDAFELLSVNRLE